MRWLKLTLFALFLLSTQAASQVPVPEPFDGPVREEWRLPLEQFLHDMGIRDTSQIIATAKAGHFGIL